MGQSGRVLRGTGNELGADDVKKQVDSDDNQQKPIYQLVNVKNGGGKLIDIIKSSARHSGSGSFGVKSSDCASSRSQLDSTIHDLVEPLLYNKGRGKLVHLSKIWRWRYGGVEASQSNDEPDENVKPDADPTKYRWVCWKLEERGFVGETALHICFLLSTPTHMILARKLLDMFPMLINDIYTNDMYFGESSLHMAIVNEDVRIVKLLLDHGANVHERCLGSFFLPIDQKDKANGVLRRIFDKIQAKDAAEKISPKLNSDLYSIDLLSNQFNSVETNYDGYAYWGEYPLSFAACLGLSDCYKLLLAHNANPNLQDSNGNSTLHMAVIADKKDMFDLCYSNGADLNLLNKQNLSPLTLAASLRRVDMFFHILTIQRQVSWIFCNVGFLEMPLSGVDSINTQTGACNDDSVLSIVVFGGSNEHLQMLDGLLSQLLRVKWETASRGKFYAWLYQFLLFLLISTVAYVTRFVDVQTSIWLLSYSDLNTYSEYALVLFALYYLWIITQRIIPGVSRKTVAQSPEMSMFALTCLLILGCVPLRIFAFQQVEDFVAALVMFTLPLKILFFCRASRSVGSFVVMIHKILFNDVLCFAVFLLIFVAGFSQSFLIMFKTHRPTLSATNSTQVDRNYFINLFDGVISMHMMALNEFGTVFDELDLTDYPKLAKVLFCVYMVLVSILLINMLIAMLGKTYQDISSQPNESLRQWARTLLLVERMWTNQHRLRMLDRYSHANDQCYYYGSTWPLTSEDLEQINTLKELKAENVKAISRTAAINYFGGGK